MISKCIFTLAHEAGNHNFYPVYRTLMKSQWKSYESLQKAQERQLRHMINFAYQNVPYYHRLFNGLDVRPEDIKTIKDLEKLPLLKKKTITDNPDDFKPSGLSGMKFITTATGGTTGTPLQYRQSSFDRFMSGALLYRGWGYAGYELGDRMVFLAGTSLDTGNRSFLVTRAHEFARNLKKLSSFDMGDREMKEYSGIINSFRPKFLRGYASSYFFFASWLEKNDVRIHKPEAIFTTSEKLYPTMRSKIEEVFGCPVYDTYGLNDGGVTAFECSAHAGMHIDTERSIMEVVDGKGAQIESGEGRIVATSLYNYAMPFLRYDTSDDGYLLDDECSCGRKYRLLREISGRTVDVLVTPEGKNVHGWFFLHIFKFQREIKEYQVIQETLDRIVIKIVPDKGFDERQLDVIRDIVRTRSEGWSLEFKIVDRIERTGSGKYKFIKNNYIDQSPQA